MGTVREAESHVSRACAARSGSGGDGQGPVNAGRTCVSLARGLREAQLAAFKMLTDAVEPVARPAPRVLSRSPSSLASVAKPVMSDSKRGIGLKDATAVFDAITRALAADPGLVLDIDWRLHPQEESVS